MDSSSFDNLNILYQFKNVDEFPIIKRSLHRLSLSTTSIPPLFKDATNGHISPKCSKSSADEDNTLLTKKDNDNNVDFNNNDILTSPNITRIRSGHNKHYKRAISNLDLMSRARLCSLDPGGSSNPGKELFSNFKNLNESYNGSNNIISSNSVLINNRVKNNLPPGIPEENSNMMSCDCDEGTLLMPIVSGTSRLDFEIPNSSVDLPATKNSNEEKDTIVLKSLPLLPYIKKSIPTSSAYSNNKYLNRAQTVDLNDKLISMKGDGNSCEPIKKRYYIRYNPIREKNELLSEEISCCFGGNSDSTGDIRNRLSGRTSIFSGKLMKQQRGSLGSLQMWPLESSPSLEKLYCLT
ncbi:unnamed protein product [Gordionus sp. m RMFG-2023]